LQSGECMSDASKVAAAGSTRQRIGREAVDLFSATLIALVTLFVVQQSHVRIAPFVPLAPILVALVARRVVSARVSFLLSVGLGAGLLAAIAFSR